VIFEYLLSGMLTVELTSAAPEKTLDVILLEKIPIANVKQISELTYQINVRRREYQRLAAILRKRGDNLKKIKAVGLYWWMKKLICRPVILCVFVLLILSSVYLPSRIFFISVDGNTTVPDRLIISAAESCGIRFGASRKHVRSEQVKNALLSAVPQLQWAGINTSGCTAIISVRERTEIDQPADNHFVSNVVARRDGFILSATVTRGTALCHPGETVTEGQMLISGYADCGFCIQASRAEGEIYAQTNRTIQAVMPETCFVPQKVLKRKYDISLLLGKKRINLWKDSRISDASCGRMYEEYYVSLPGGFQLPVAVCVDRYLEYELREDRLPEENAQLLLQQFSEDYLIMQMVAGTILDKQQAFSCASGLFKMEGTYTCTEMIGREQREQIGVINGKRS